jgi:hypothetical protein
MTKKEYENEKRRIKMKMIKEIECAKSDSLTIEKRKEHLLNAQILKIELQLIQLDEPKEDVTLLGIIMLIGAIIVFFILILSIIKLY